MVFGRERASFLGDIACLGMGKYLYEIFLAQDTWEYGKWWKTPFFGGWSIYREKSMSPIPGNLIFGI